MTASVPLAAAATGVAGLARARSLAPGSVLASVSGNSFRGALSSFSASTFKPQPQAGNDNPTPIAFCAEPSSAIVANSSGGGAGVENLQERPAAASIAIVDNSSTMAHKAQTGQDVKESPVDPLNGGETPTQQEVKSIEKVDETIASSNGE